MKVRRQTRERPCPQRIAIRPFVYAFVPGAQLSLVAGELSGPDAREADDRVGALASEVARTGAAVGCSYNTHHERVVMVAVPVASAEQLSDRRGLSVVFGVVCAHGGTGAAQAIGPGALEGCIRTVAIVSEATSGSSRVAAEALTARLQAGQWAAKPLLVRLLAAWTLAGSDIGIRDKRVPRRRSRGYETRLGLRGLGEGTDSAVLIGQALFATPGDSGSAIFAVDFAGMTPGDVKGAMGEAGSYRRFGDLVIYELAGGEHGRSAGSSGGFGRGKPRR